MKNSKYVSLYEFAKQVLIYQQGTGSFIPLNDKGEMDITTTKKGEIKRYLKQLSMMIYQDEYRFKKVKNGPTIIKQKAPNKKKEKEIKNKINTLNNKVLKGKIRRTKYTLSRQEIKHNEYKIPKSYLPVLVYIIGNFTRCPQIKKIRNLQKQLNQLQKTSSSEIELRQEDIEIQIKNKFIEAEEKEQYIRQELIKYLLGEESQQVKDAISEMCLEEDRLYQALADVLAEDLYYMGKSIVSNIAKESKERPLYITKEERIYMLMKYRMKTLEWVNAIDDEICRVKQEIDDAKLDRRLVNNITQVQGLQNNSEYSLPMELINSIIKREEAEGSNRY